MAEILAGRSINKTFGSFQVLKDVNFTLSEGEALGIVGPNGAGKTTLFSVVAGSLLPSIRNRAVLGRRRHKSGCCQPMSRRHRPTHQVPRRSSA